MWAELGQLRERSGSCFGPTQPRLREDPELQRFPGLPQRYFWSLNSHEQCAPEPPGREE